MIKEIDEFKGSPKFAIRFANTVFVSGIICSVLISIYALYKKYNLPDFDLEFVSNTFYLICFLFSGISATLFGLGLRLNHNLKVNLSILFVTVGITVYAFETYLEFTTDYFTTESKIKLAKQFEVSYDTRTKMEVLKDLNNSGIEAYLNLQPNFFINLNGLEDEFSQNLISQQEENNKIKKIYPLGGISNITTILANESGYYPIIETDEHGFNNPKGLYKKNKVDIVLIGDSFIEGYSVRSNESISAVLRESGFKAISFGKGGNGPLLELATLKEYAKPLQPKVVLWSYYMNDLNWGGIVLGNLGTELRSSILRSYLNEDNFSQNLISRQDEVNRVLKKYAQKEWVKRNKDTHAIKILKLSQLRSMINLTALKNPSPLPLSTIPEQELVVFKNILEKSKKMVSEWGGKLYFVYLPSYILHFGVLTDTEHEYYEFALRVATELDIPIIDIYTEVLVSHLDPLSLFAFRKSFHHYSAEGYRLVAETIDKRLKDDGLFPSMSSN